MRRGPRGIVATLVMVPQYGLIATPQARRCARSSNSLRRKRKLGASVHRDERTESSPPSHSRPRAPSNTAYAMRSTSSESDRGRTRATHLLRTSSGRRLAAAGPETGTWQPRNLTQLGNFENSRPGPERPPGFALPENHQHPVMATHLDRRDRQVQYRPLQPPTVVPSNLSGH
jgi:hypothetical protein